MDKTPQQISAEMLAVSDQIEQEIAQGLAAMRQAAKLIARLPAPELSVPYRSQWESDAMLNKGDCGPACVAMLVQYATGQRSPIDRVSAECGMSESHKATFPDDLIRGAGKHDVKLACLVVTSVVMAKTPSIALVHYDDLPRMDMGYTRGHWVVVTRVCDGQVTYHDPDWWGTRIADGEGRRVTVEVFDQAMKDCELDGNPAGLVLVLP